MDGPQPVVLDARVNRSRRVELVAAGLTLLVGLGIVAGAVAYRHRMAKATLFGGAVQSLAPDALTKSLGDVAPDEAATVAFTLRNLTDHPIRIQGAQTSCACTVVEGIPRTIAAGDAQDFKGVVHTSTKPGQFDGSFVLYTDDDNEPEVRLGYSGRVVNASR